MQMKKLPVLLYRRRSGLSSYEHCTCFSYHLQALETPWNLLCGGRNWQTWPLFLRMTVGETLHTKRRMGRPHREYREWEENAMQGRTAVLGLAAVLTLTLTSCGVRSEADRGTELSLIHI